MCANACIYIYSYIHAFNPNIFTQSAINPKSASFILNSRHKSWSHRTLLSYPWWRSQSPDRLYSRRAAELEKAHSQTGVMTTVCATECFMTWKRIGFLFFTRWTSSVSLTKICIMCGLYRTVCIVSWPRIISYLASRF